MGIDRRVDHAHRVASEFTLSASSLGSVFSPIWRKQLLKMRERSNECRQAGMSGEMLSYLAPRTQEKANNQFSNSKNHLKKKTLAFQNTFDIKYVAGSLH